MLHKYVMQIYTPIKSINACSYNMKKGEKRYE